MTETHSVHRFDEGPKISSSILKFCKNKIGTFAQRNFEKERGNPEDLPGFEERLTYWNNKLDVTPEDYKPREYSRISAYRGDDSITLSDCKPIGPLTCAIDEIVLGIKVSEKDTGRSSSMGDYTEERILMPITRGTTFRDSTKYNSTDNIPLVLDPIKMKNLNPCRKQSLMEDDLASKIGNLGQSAKWTSKSWFTYDFHQLALILACEVFDFHSAETFPWLGKEEGGNGCFPPWNNTENVLLYAHHFQRGKCKDAIIAMINESRELMQGYKNPADLLMLKGVAAYRAGSEVWKQYVSVYETIKRGGLSQVELDDLIASSNDLEIPIELKQKGIIIPNKNFFFGSAIMQLRSQGLLMTDIDVKIYESSQEKYAAIFGNTPIKDVLEKQEQEKELLKGRPLKVLSSIAKDIRERHDMPEIKIQPPAIDSEDINAILHQYYKQKGELFPLLTSFSHTNMVRVYKTQDVINHYGQINHRGFIKDLFEESFDVPSKFRSILVTQEEEETWSRIIEWFDKPNPFQHNLPPGLGVEDARLAKQVADLELTSPELVILISNDNNLARYLAEMIRTIQKEKSDFNIIHFGHLPVDAYFSLCAYANKTERTIYPFFNIRTGKEEKIPKFISELWKKNLFLLERKGEKERYIRILYDVSNIERSTQRLTFINGTPIKITDGFMIKRELNNMRLKGSPVSLETRTTIRRILTKSHKKEVKLDFNLRTKY